MDLIETGGAPAAIGPYSQAVAADGLLFCSGQIALDPETMEMVGATAAEQAHQVLENLEAVLRAGGSSLKDVLKTTLYLADMGDFTAVNEVYAVAFGEHRPARATVAAAGLPKGALVEIDAVARQSS
ncbi:MAG: RidA family protein [Planctomycetota bacterium]|nr:RidA family protein [Planctomycetota bacterium]